MEFSNDRTKRLLAVTRSQKKIGRMSEQSTYIKLFLASSLIHIYATSALKVGFMKLPLEELAQDKGDSKAAHIVMVQLTSSALESSLLVRLSSHTVNIFLKK